MPRPCSCFVCAVGPWRGGVETLCGIQVTKKALTLATLAVTSLAMALAAPSFVIQNDQVQRGLGAGGRSCVRADPLLLGFLGRCPESTCPPPPPSTARHLPPQFIRDGTPTQIMSSCVHYFRIRPEYWADRLARVAAMGSNAVEVIPPIPTCAVQRSCPPTPRARTRVATLPRLQRHLHGQCKWWVVAVEPWRHTCAPPPPTPLPSPIPSAVLRRKSASGSSRRSTWPNTCQHLVFVVAVV